MVSQNHRGILFMVAAVTGFIVNDTCLKIASQDIPVSQAIFIRSLMAFVLVLPLCWHRSAWPTRADLGSRLLWWRTVGELGATATYLTALTHLELANITSIAQTTPLAITAAAALFLGEKVGLRRWTAIAVGFLAVLLIIRPGTEGFNAWSLLALLSVAFVVLRDLTSRMMPAGIDPLVITLLSMVALTFLGLSMALFEPWQPLTTRALLLCTGSGVTLTAAFVMIFLAMRTGEVSVVTPFRYTILLWAVLIQVVVFSSWPDALTFVGSGLLVATGVYTLLRERRLRLRAAAAAIPVA